MPYIILGHSAGGEAPLERSANLAAIKGRQPFDGLHHLVLSLDDEAANSIFDHFGSRIGTRSPKKGIELH
jgi:hypothetical protein